MLQKVRCVKLTDATRSSLHNQSESSLCLEQNGTRRFVYMNECYCMCLKRQVYNGQVICGKEEIESTADGMCDSAKVIREREDKTR